MSLAEPSQYLLLAHDFPPMGGGMARWMEALALGLPAGTLTVCTGTVDGSEAADRLLPQPVIRIGVRSERLRTLSGVVRWSVNAVAIARSANAAFTWCDTIRPAAYAANWVRARTAVPYGIMVVGNDILTLRRKVRGSALRRALMRRVLGEAATIVAISEWTATECRALLQELGLEEVAQRVVVVPLGTDPLRWKPDAEGAALFRKRRSLPDGKWLVTVARVVDYKGQDDGIRVLAALSAQHPDLRYAIVGRGPFIAQLRTLAVSLGVGDRVHFVEDATDAELSAAYSLGDVYLGLTRETALDVEGFGLSLVEAAACGVAVVAARSGGIADAVEDGVTGLLVASQDVAAAAEAVALLLSDPPRARQMGSAGRARVEHYFNWQRVVADMRAIASEVQR